MAEDLKANVQTAIRAEKKIRTLTEKVGCSSAGRAFLEEASDVFNDEPRDLVGFPDLVTANSVIQPITLTTTYQVPSGGQDVHIYMDTVDTEHFMALQPRTIAGGGNAIPDTWTVNGNLGATKRGGVRLRAGSIGASLTQVNDYNLGLGLPQTYLVNSRSRVVAKAFKVENVTPMLTVGGAVTVYRDSTSMGSNPSAVATLVATTNTQYSGSYGMYRLPSPPVTLAEATLIPGAHSWLAKDGCYVVPTMGSQINDPHDSDYSVLVCNDASNAAGYDYVSVSGTTTQPTPTDRPVLKSPFFVSGAYFTGLPAGSELKITCRYIIERFVAQDNLDLVVLSRPSPAYDPVALELYAKAMHHLPHGMPASANASGDWISEIADVLGSFGVPGMPLVKGAVKAYQTVTGADKVDQKKKKQKAKTAQAEDEVVRLRQQLLDMQRQMAQKQSPMVNKTITPPKMLQSTTKKPAQLIPSKVQRGGTR